MDTLRIGFIGAGGIARSRHLPGLRSIEGAEVVAVCNRSRESSEAVARDWSIPRVEEQWRAIVENPDIDAVFIGTWPYTHAEMSIAALEAGKHVFCQARMAMNLEEAKAMAETAADNPGLVAMVCPPPHRMPYEPFVRQAVAEKLGPPVSVEVTSVNGGNRDRTKVSWREDVQKSGRQVLAVGIIAETLNAWVGPYAELNAGFATPIPSKAGRRIEIPQTVTISGRLESGALATEHHTGLAADKDSRGSWIVIRGMEGTLRYRFMADAIEMAGPEEPLAAVEVPPELTRPWRVEQDFVQAVRAARRGESWRVSPDFDEGLLYMRKVEAVHLATESGCAVKPARL